jgi:hypothetical protein
VYNLDSFVDFIGDEQVHGQESYVGASSGPVLVLIRVG